MDIGGRRQGGGDQREKDEDVGRRRTTRGRGGATQCVWELSGRVGERMCQRAHGVSVR